MRFVVRFFTGLFFGLSILVCSAGAVLATTSDDVAKKTGEAVNTTVQYGKESKEEFQARMQKHMDEVQKNISELQQKAAVSAGETKEKINAEVTDLEAKRDTLAIKLGRLKKSSDRAWAHLKSGVQKAWSDVKSSANDASDEFDTGNRLTE